MVGCGKGYSLAAFGKGAGQSGQLTVGYAAVGSGQGAQAGGGGFDKGKGWM